MLQGIRQMARKTASDFFDNDEGKVKEEKNENVKVPSVKKDEKTVDSPKSETSQKEKYSNEKESSEKEPLCTTSSQGQSREEYMNQYQQYMQQYQQYQQYYAQYYNQSYTNYSPTTSDPAYEYFTGTTSATTAPPAASFDASRASRQMAAYFDPTKFQSVLSPEMLAAQRAQKEQQQSKLSAKEIEAFKKKKIEKKKAKNRWFYE